jgi:hypothetical protein
MSTAATLLRVRINVPPRYFVVVNVQVAEPDPDPFVPLVCAVYAVPFFRRTDGLKVTVVHGELQLVFPFTVRPKLSASDRLDEVSGSS